MTPILDKAWWCNYCANNHNGCSKDVPYYASSVHCKYWSEHSEPVPKKPIRHTLNWYKKHVLVETI
jgi:hypothetical protein